ncbi:MAG: hypothetical protein WA702_05105 [Bradyrhizobium sp.]|jgi:hypothetical protein|uniref:hypothetical protein n=1 Tax=Bradyrhizobium sp. TaxID=376 RepID=UPI003C7D7A42
MTTAVIARAILGASKSEEFETLKLLTVFSLTGLMISLLSAAYGLDMSWAFF